MPMTPFIGVRISWLMLARNSDLSRAAASASSRACASSPKSRARSSAAPARGATIAASSAISRVKRWPRFASPRTTQPTVPARSTSGMASTHLKPSAWARRLSARKRVLEDRGQGLEGAHHRVVGGGEREPEVPRHVRRGAAAAEGDERVVLASPGRRRRPRGRAAPPRCSPGGPRRRGRSRG